MRSPVSPIIANTYMEYFEGRALRTAHKALRLWKRYEANTFVIQYTKHKENFLQHSNNIDSPNKFTLEDMRENGYMLFLDILVTPEHNGALTTRVYRKFTHTDLYMHWDSHHQVGAKYSVIYTLTHRAKTVSSILKTI